MHNLPQLQNTTTGRMEFLAPRQPHLFPVAISKNSASTAETFVYIFQLEFFYISAEMAMNVGSLLLKSSLPVNVAIRRVGTFKSAISLDKLYPESVNVKPFTPPVSQDGNFSGNIKLSLFLMNVNVV